MIELRKDGNRIGIALLIYSIISFVIVIADMFIRTIFVTVQSMLNGEASDAELLVDAMLKQAEKEATSTMIGVGIGLLFLILFYRKRISIKKDIFVSRKKMTLKRFFQILCVFMGGQIVFSVVYELMEAGLNLIGYTAVASMESASSTSETISMFLYTGIVAPIVEEVVYRGFVMKSFEKYGKTLAIVSSAVFFGIMHANLPQGVFAFCVGLILGYVAMEYSIVWSILLHFLNNCIFGDLFSMATAGLSEETQLLISNGVWGIFFIGAMIIVWMKRKEIRQYLVDNKMDKKSLLYVFTRIAVVIFVVLELALAIFSLERIG